STSAYGFSFVVLHLSCFRVPKDNLSCFTVPKNNFSLQKLYKSLTKRCELEFAGHRIIWAETKRRKE
ncbi:MAG: hypothetical protein RSA24_05360, partial [Clostridia bacterium]